MSEENTAVRSIDALHAAIPGRVQPFVVVLSGGSAGRTFRLDKSPVVIGRSPRCHFILDEDGVSRQHVVIERDGEGGLTVRDLGSTNGTFINGVRVGDRAIPLAENDRIQVGSGAVLKFSLQDDLEEQFQAQVFRAAVADEKTGLYNRRYLADRLPQELSFHAGRGRSLSLVSLEMDGFSALADHHGEVAAEDVLVASARFLRQYLPADALVARAGDDEIAVLLRDTAGDEAERLAQDVCARLAEQTLGEGHARVTFSAGIATLGSPSSPDRQDLLAEAEAALRQARKAGRGETRRSGQ